MINRTLTSKLTKSAKQFPIVTLTGPRQSGKTTLVKNVFKNYKYVSLEIPDQRQFALEDPKGFLNHFNEPVIFDEIQRVPNLFSYIQGCVDEHQDWVGRFILTGSQNFLLLQNISQSLAGRCAVLHLLPFSLAELHNRNPIDLEKLGKHHAIDIKPPSKDLFEILFTGFYPRIHDKQIPPREWLAGYYQTYIERDVRNVLKIGDLDMFGKFLRLCAGRCGQLLNLSNLASDCGISHTTARRWISILKTSFIIILLHPYYKNFGKRLIKSPKLYFLDTGLLCYLLNIRTPDELFHRAERGAVFENFVISEMYKNFMHRGEQPCIYFWRDTAGHEIDIVIDQGPDLIPVEIKSARTIAPDFFKNLVFWRKITGDENPPEALIYGGDISYKRSGVVIYPWFAL